MLKGMARLLCECDSIMRMRANTTLFQNSHRHAAFPSGTIHRGTTAAGVFRQEGNTRCSVASLLSRVEVASCPHTHRHSMQLTCRESAHPRNAWCSKASLLSSVEVASCPPHPPSHHAGTCRESAHPRHPSSATATCWTAEDAVCGCLPSCAWAACQPILVYRLCHGAVTACVCTGKK